MAKDKEKFNDVESLANQLHLGSVHYREFNAPTPINRAAAAKVAPAAVPPAPATPARAEVAAAKPARPAVAAPSLEARVGSVVENPVAFTFERLRRQAIASPMRGHALHLDLPERSAFRERIVAERFRSQDMDAVFAGLESAATRGNVAEKTGT